MKRDAGLEGPLGADPLDSADMKEIPWLHTSVSCASSFAKASGAATIITLIFIVARSETAQEAGLAERVATDVSGEGAAQFLNASEEPGFDCPYTEMQGNTIPWS